MPSIVHASQVILIELAEQLKARLEENVFSSLLTRLLDVWGKGKLIPDQCSRVMNLTFQYGKVEQKTSVLELMNQSLQDDGFPRAILPYEATIDFIFSIKGVRKADTLLNFHSQAFLFLSKMTSFEPMLMRKTIKDDELGLLLTRMAELLATKEFQHTAFTYYFLFFSKVMAWDENKYDEELITGRTRSQCSYLTIFAALCRGSLPQKPILL